MPLRSIKRGANSFCGTFHAFLKIWCGQQSTATSPCCSNHTPSGGPTSHQLAQPWRTHHFSRRNANSRDGWFVCMVLVHRCFLPVAASVWPCKGQTTKKAGTSHTLTELEVSVNLAEVNSSWNFNSGNFQSLTFKSKYSSQLKVKAAGLTAGRPFNKKTSCNAIMRAISMMYKNEFIIWICLFSLDS